MHGESVPYKQMAYMSVGLVAMPSVNGTAEALLDLVADPERKETRKSAMVSCLRVRTTPTPNLHHTCTTPAPHLHHTCTTRAAPHASSSQLLTYPPHRHTSRSI